MRTRQRLIVGVLALVLGVALAAAPSADTLASAAPAFETRGSVEQLSVVHATPGATLELKSAAGDVVATATADELGSALWRSVPAGDGYRVEQMHGEVTSVGDPVRVLAPADTPAPTLYDSQQLTDGFGYITTRDGTTLSATVRLPGPPDQGPYPTLVEYSGYAASNTHSPPPSTQIAQLLGYATVAVNVRGTGCSGGAFSYFETLQALDGYDVIETVAAQPWVAHGQVGMIGISYPGISQLFVGATKPPNLAAIAPLSVMADTYRSTLYPGGIFNDGFALAWAKERADQARPYGQGWEQGIVDAGGVVGSECADNQLLRLQNQDLVAEIEANPYYGAAGAALAPETFVDQIDVPVFSSGAWQDEQTGGHFAVMWDKFSNARLFATNGTHVDSLLADLNRWYEFLEFYVARRVPQLPAQVRALAPAIIESQLGIPGVQLEADRFTGYPTYEDARAAYESEPDVRVLVENGAGNTAAPGAPSGTFELTFPSWPPPQTEPTPWYFQPDQRLAPGAAQVADDDGRASTSYEYAPDAKPDTTFSGTQSEIWSALPAYDWRPLPIGNALAFDSDPLPAETVMVGSASVDVWLRSTAADVDLEVTLTEVRPDGEEMYVQSGWLRASHRALDLARSSALRPVHTHAEADAAALPAGEFVEARVELFPFAHVFRPGSKIRIAIEAPGGNRPFWTFDALEEKALNEIAHSVGRPSRVVLPVIPGIDAPNALPACPSLRGQPCRVAYGASQPVDVSAATVDDDATVVWSAPATVRPGLTLSGYRVHEEPDGAVVDVDASTLSASFADLGEGPHLFTVEASYAEGGASGRSTPSNTVTAAQPGIAPGITSRTAPDPAKSETNAAPNVTPLALLPSQVDTDVTLDDLDPNDPLFALAQACGEGDLAACDELYEISEVSSDFEAFADTCGGREEIGSGGSCDLLSAAAVTFEDLNASDPLYPLAVSCRDGDLAACDQLYAESDIGSDLEAYADTCGGREEPGTGGLCDTEDSEFDDFDEPGFDDGSDGLDDFIDSNANDLASTGTESRAQGLTAAVLMIMGGCLVLSCRAPARVYAQAAPRNRRGRIS